MIECSYHKTVVANELSYLVLFSYLVTILPTLADSGRRWRIMQNLLAFLFLVPAEKSCKCRPVVTPFKHLPLRTRHLHF